uniref:Uncharacterized protein n=1 Tax=Aegilops tauschii subsp. strangulata TaxID=200361 RepID=A0A453RMQ1_AEGTS
AMGVVPLLCRPTISNVVVTKTLIDGGAGLNVLFVETFETLQVPYERLMPTRPFLSVTDGSCKIEMRFPVTFGTRKNYRTEFIIFDVAHIGLPYNAILGYPTLSKFMAVTHHAYDLVKIPSCSGTLTVHCDEKDVMHTLEHAYKAASPTYLADEDVLGPAKEAPVKKKPLLSQEQAESKKAFLD